MKLIFLMTGAPGSGKTTWIRENGLENYTISPDDIRRLVQNPKLTLEGVFEEDLNNDREVWAYLYEILNNRMLRGDFTIVDAVFSKPEEFRRIKRLAQKHKYRIMSVSFRDVPIETVLERRPFKERIKLMYARFKNYPIPNWAPEIDKSNVKKALTYEPVDITGKYKKVHHIGDIHGCSTVLQEYLNGDLKDDELYIFLGDYVDRGIENVEVLRFLFDIYKKDNVILLEGNHEIWIKYYGSGEIREIRSNEFKNKTMPELDKEEISKKSIRLLYRSLSQVVYYKFHDKKVFLCHGGIPVIPENTLLISSEDLIKGVGNYLDIGTVSDSFLKNYKDEETYLIHGHRNLQRFPINVNNRVFNLESSVERGGYLRVVTLDDTGEFETFNVLNKVYNKEQLTIHEPAKSVEELVSSFRRTSFVQEKVFGDISSFNFTRTAFRKKEWNQLTTQARGLFINTKSNIIVARSFNKFFNLNEREETKLENINNNFEAPFTVYEKTNGFLGISGYDRISDNLLLASKSVLDGEYSKMFQDFFPEDKRKYLKKILSKEDISLMFEVVEYEKDPHIIKYDESFIILIGGVQRNLKGRYLSYNELKSFKFKLKKKVKIINSIGDFLEWYDKIMHNLSLEEEGYVIEDANQKMFKIKLPYYNFWKQMRGVLHKMSSRGRDTFFHTAKLFDDTSVNFLNWLHSKDVEYLKTLNIIEARDEFHRETL